MSFKLFVYYCAVCGAWAAFFGWGFGKLLAPANAYGSALTHGVALGLLVGLALGLVDALWSLSSAQVVWVVLRVGSSVLGGCIAGMIGAIVGQFLFELTGFNPVSIFGWALTGLLIG